MSIADVEATLHQSLPAFSSLGKVVKFDCGGDGMIVVDARTAPATLSRDGTIPADCTLEMTAEVLQQILDGELDPTGAFMSGKLRIQGDMGVAMELASVLG